MSASDAAHAPSGSLNFSTVAGLLAGSRAWFADGGRIVIDLSGVTQADSAGVALLVEWLRLARRAGGEIEFRNVPVQVRNLVEVSGLGDALFSKAAPRA